MSVNRVNENYYIIYNSNIFLLDIVGKESIISGNNNVNISRKNDTEFVLSFNTFSFILNRFNCLNIPNFVSDANTNGFNRFLILLNIISGYSNFTIGGYKNQNIKNFDYNNKVIFNFYKRYRGFNLYGKNNNLPTSLSQMTDNVINGGFFHLPSSNTSVKIVGDDTNDYTKNTSFFLDYITLDNTRFEDILYLKTTDTDNINNITTGPLEISSTINTEVFRSSKLYLKERDVDNNNLEDSMNTGEIYLVKDTATATSGVPDNFTDIIDKIPVGKNVSYRNIFTFLKDEKIFLNDIVISSVIFSEDTIVKIVLLSRYGGGGDDTQYPWIKEMELYLTKDTQEINVNLSHLILNTIESQYISGNDTTDYFGMTDLCLAVQKINGGDNNIFLECKLNGYSYSSIENYYKSKIFSNLKPGAI